VVTLTLETDEKKLEVIETTPEHPFAVRIGEGNEISWVNAIDLETGQSLARGDGKSGRLLSSRVEARNQRMYDLSVNQVHNFFVGENGWLVHNLDWCMGDLFRHIDQGSLNRNGSHLSGAHTLEALDDLGLDYVISNRNGIETATITLPNGQTTVKAIIPEDVNLGDLVLAAAQKDCKGSCRIYVDGYEFEFKPPAKPGAPPTIYPIRKVK
jgi:Pretoxin HINT domain